MSEIMFENIYYDRFTNKMHLWENIDGESKHHTFDYEHFYWMPDQTKMSPITDIYGVPMRQFSTDRAKNVPHNDKICEGDVKEEIKFLHNRYEPVVTTPRYENINVAFYDIETEYSDELQRYSEPSEAFCPINLITLYCSKSKNMYIFAKHPYDGTLDKAQFENSKVKINNFTYHYIADELKMLEKFVKTLHKEKVAIITGWNVSSYDNEYVINRLKNVGSEKSLSPIKEIYYNARYNKYQIAGLSVLDYLELYRDRFMSHKLRENYKLDTIAFLELNKGKIEYDETLVQLYKDDWNKFVVYGIVDTLLIVELEATLRFIETTITMCHDSIIPFERIYSPIADHEGMALIILHKQNMVLNNFSNIKDERSLPGGFTFADTGRHKYVVCFDFKSLYPSIILRDNIGPDTLVKNTNLTPINVVELELNGIRQVIPFGTIIHIERDLVEKDIPIEELLETDYLIV